MTINMTGGFTDFVSHGGGEAPRSENNVRGPVAGNFQQMSGGVLRYSMAPQDPGAYVETHQPQAVRADVGAVYRSGANGGAIIPTRMEVSVSSITDHIPGILGTARNKSGNPTHDVKPDSILEYRGTTCQAQTLEYMGVLRRDAHGRYYEVESTPARSHQQAQVQQSQQASVPSENDFTVEHFPQEIEDTLTAAIAPIADSDPT